MKEFLKYVAATVVGLIVFGIIQVCLFFVCMFGIAASSFSGNSKANVKNNSVLVLSLDGTISETSSEDNPLKSLLGENLSTNISLYDMCNAIKYAKTCDKIKGIYIEAGQLSAEPASFTTLHNALADFKKSGKWIISYGDNFSQGAYYVSSVADKILVNPQGQVSWHGMGSRSFYVKDMLNKFGVKMKVVKVGKFKSATEMFTEDHMSQENREQTERYVSGIWKHMINDVAASRKITVDSLNAYADRVVDFESTSTLKSMKMIDGTCYANEIKSIVKKQLQIDEKKEISQVSVEDIKSLQCDNNSSDNSIAVYFCEGDIVQEAEQGAALGGTSNIVAEDVCKDLEEIYKNDDIKAVVVRINSGGGDAYASEQLWHMINEINKKKPVVISMGGMAASGGYYMSSGASWIIAEPTTLTGSIGIFGTFPDASGLITEKLGVKFDEVKTNKNSTMSTLGYSRPLSDSEEQILQKYVDRGYTLFKKRVSDGRHMSMDAVENIAQGRVWLGEDAKNIKLVDQIGNLNDAIDKASKLAKLKDYQIATYPMPEDWTAQLLRMTDKGNYLDEKLYETLGEFYAPFAYIKTLNKQSPLQARIPFVVNFN